MDEQAKKMRELDDKRKHDIEEKLGIKFTNTQWEQYKLLSIKRKR